MDVMSNSPSRRGLSASIELAAVVSTFAVVAAITLSWFAGLGESWIVYATIAAATYVGFRQPEAQVRTLPVPVERQIGTAPRH